MGRAYGHGWIALPSEGELYLEHGVPRLVRVEGSAPRDVERLAAEIAEVAGVHFVTLGQWEADAEAGDMEAVVHVAPADVKEILQRLAHASAVAYYDRYHRAMDTEDVDFDDEAYAQDMNFALAACGLHWGEVDERPLKLAYLRTLHADVDAMARGMGSEEPGTSER